MEEEADPHGRMVGVEAARAWGVVGVGGGEAVNVDCCLTSADELAPPCPPPREHDLTPSEVALSKVLRAWEEWPGDPDTYSEKLHDIGVSLNRLDLLSGGEPNEAGRALLDRARKAGVL